jgi:hypothetical protein
MPTMTRIYRTDISFMLDEIANLITISDSLFRSAEEKYQAVGMWLGEDRSPLAVYSPIIYPQGSFLIGTVTKPLGERDEYDIDLVLELLLSKDTITQKRLKNMAGDRLKDHEVYRRMLDEEGKRCWTLIYADSAKLHLDILPAVPNNDYREFLKNQGVKSDLAETGIAITDKTLPNYERLDPDWPRSNPKGFAAWFKSRMISQFEAQRKYLAEALKAGPANVPEYKIRTPLQKSVQLLKRHRDVVFEGKDDKPASIIISTLAAHAYNNEFDIVEAMTNIIDGIPNYIAVRDGKARVQNPVDPSENFADGWVGHPGREQNFRNWVNRIQVEMNTVLECNDTDRICEFLAQMFGENVSVVAVNRYKEYAQTRIKTISTVIPIVRPTKPWGF